MISKNDVLDLYEKSNRGDQSNKNYLEFVNTITAFFLQKITKITQEPDKIIRDKIYDDARFFMHKSFVQNNTILLDKRLMKVLLTLYVCKTEESLHNLRNQIMNLRQVIETEIRTKQIY